MKRFLIIVLLIFCLPVKAMAIEINPPEAPESVQEYIDNNSESFAEGLLFILKQVTPQIYPNIAQASRICLSIVGICLILSAVQGLVSQNQRIITLLGVVSICVVLLRSVNAMIHLSSRTVQELSEYGKLLIPVMTAALAAQGASATSAALYAGTVFFDSVLSSLTAKILVPGLYVYLCLCIVHKATNNTLLQQMSQGMKWLITWGLKIILYLFTGYLSITGVVSGSTDASMLKATKIMVSGAVPVVGNIISDASETILIGAGIMKNAAGIYGMLAIIAVCIGPFLKIGIHYLLLKITSGVCAMFSDMHISGIVKDFSVCMGFLLGMVGTVCLLLLVSTVCFMKGVT